MHDPYWRIEDHSSFRIVREIARGGMGAVYEALQEGAEGFSKRVALKVLLQDLTDDPEFLQRFVDEAKLVADLVHENVVQIYRLGHHQDRYYMALEFVEGVTLEDFLLRHEELERRVPTELCAFLIARVCRALEYAHTKRDPNGGLLGIVHRDVSPGNVMLSFGGVVKLTDFGIAKARTVATDLEGEVLLGKVRYMSPEQASFQVTDCRSDVFTAGILLYELLSGEALFEGDDTIVTLDYVVGREFPPLREVNPNVPPALCAIVDRALEALDARYPTAGQMGFALEQFMYADRFGPTNLSLHRYLKSLYLGRVADLIDPRVPDPYFDRLGLSI